MVSAAFPPTGGPGVQRSLKFAKYLPQFGWLPTVWAAETLAGLPSDPTLLDDLPPEITVHRWNRIGPAQKLRRALPRRFAVAKAIDWRLEKWIARNAWPDTCSVWARTGEAAARRVIERERIDLIYSTFSPPSNHQLALQLKRQTGLPWVADFRDLWTDDHHYRPPSQQSRKADARLQEEILNEADAVIAVTPRQTEILANHVPALRHKFSTITNGFDPDDFREDLPANTRDQPPFVLAYVGRMDRRGPEDVWLAALKNLAERLGPARDSFLLRIVGHADRGTLAAIREAGVPHTFTGYVAHAEAVREMRSADALLLLPFDGPNAGSVIRAKLFEYLAAQRPIVAVGPRDGETAKIVRCCGAGVTVSPDAKAIGSALYELVERRRAGEPLRGCPPEQLEPFSRVTLTERLASVFNGLVAGAPSPACSVGPPWPT